VIHSRKFASAPKNAEDLRREEKTKIKLEPIVTKQGRYSCDRERSLRRSHRTPQREFDDKGIKMKIRAWLADRLN